MPTLVVVGGGPKGIAIAAQSVCVIGNGETAASVVISLLAKSHKRSTVDVVTSRGVLYSRGESYEENRFYSDPGDWPQLAEATAPGLAADAHLAPGVW